MKNRFFYGLFFMAMLCISLANTGCGPGTEDAAQKTDSTAAVPAMKHPFMTAFLAGGVGCDFPPQMNATVTFGVKDVFDATPCRSGPGLCGATAGINSIQNDGDSLTIYGDFCSYYPTIGNYGLNVTFNQEGAANPLASSLDSFFSTFAGGQANGSTYGLYNLPGSCILDTSLTNLLNIPHATLTEGMLCGVVCANPNNYWSIFFYGLYPGAAGSMFFALPGQDCNQSQGPAICTVKPFNYKDVNANPNAVYFNSNYNPDSSVSMTFMFNYDTLVSQQPQMAQFFNFGGVQPMLKLGQDFTFPSDPGTVASTGIPGGAIIKAGSYPMNQVNSVTFGSDAVSWGGWVYVWVQNMGAYPIKPGDGNMATRNMNKKTDVKKK